MSEQRPPIKQHLQAERTGTPRVPREEPEAADTVLEDRQDAAVGRVADAHSQLHIEELGPPSSPLHDAHLGRRRRKNLVMTVVLGTVTAIAIAMLLWVLGYVAAQGLKYLGPQFLTQTPPGDPSQGGGGFVNGIIGSLIVVGLAAAISIPIGIAAAIYLNEYGGRVASAARFLTDVLVGVPTIVTGAFVYALWVTRFGFSGVAGAIALAIIMLPLIIRATEEMLRLVPNELREAGLALGMTKPRTTVAIVLPTAIDGIITGCMLAIARAMGETAPLLLTALGNDLFIETNPTHRMETLSLQVFSNAITGFQAAQARAWAGALTMVLLVVLFTVIARIFGRRSSIAGSHS